MPLAKVVQTSFPIFLNPHAGRGADAEQEALQRAFAEAGARVDVRALPGAQLGAAIHEAALRGAPLIGVAGGDGTISSAANALAGTQAVLLPIPLGTLNHFAGRHGIPTVEAAVHAWQRAEMTSVHVGLVNKRIFINNASCGFYPHVVRHRDRLERLLPRVPAMWLAGLRVLFELPLMKLDIEIGGDCVHLRTPALWVGIGRNSLRLPVPGDATVEGEVLEIVAGRAETRRAVLALAGRLLLHLKQGLEPRAENLHVERARRFVVHARHSVDIALDGEPFRMRAPLEFSIVPDGLRLFCLVDASD